MFQQYFLFLIMISCCVRIVASDNFWISRRECYQLLSHAAEPGRKELLTRCEGVSCTTETCRPKQRIQLLADYHCCNCYTYKLYDILQFDNKIHFIFDVNYNSLNVPSTIDLSNMPHLNYSLTGIWKILVSGKPERHRLMYYDVDIVAEYEDD